MREKDIEAYLRDETRRRGGRAFKFVSPGNAGVPDRVLVLPGGRVYFVEVKAPGKKPTAIQINWLRVLRDLGFRAFWVSSKEDIDEFFKGESGSG